MATQLGLYNYALRIIGERKLASLTENREPRRILDDAYADAIKYCLEQGFWKFAQRSQKLTPSTTMIPTFGLQYAFEKPADSIKLYRISANEFFEEELLDYSEEGGFWLSDAGEIYIQYISSDPIYGNDLARWPETFTHYVGTYLASQVVERIAPTNAAKVPSMLADAWQAALSKDAMQGPPQFFPRGRWSLARWAGRHNHSRWNRKFLP